MRNNSRIARFECHAWNVHKDTQTEVPPRGSNMQSFATITLTVCDVHHETLRNTHTQAHNLKSVENTHGYHETYVCDMQHKTPHEKHPLVGIHHQNLYFQPLCRPVNPSIIFQLVQNFQSIFFCRSTTQREKDKKTFLIWIRQCICARFERLEFVFCGVGKCAKCRSVLESICARPV